MESVLKENPGSTRKHLLEILHPSLEPASPEAKKALDDMQATDAESSLAQRISPGGCGNLQLDRIRQRLEQELGRFSD